MAATIQFSETNGTVAAAATTDGISNINFGSADAPNLVAATYPIVQGQISFTKWIRVKLAALNGSHTIAAFEFWLSSPSGGGYVTGEYIGSNIHSVISSNLAVITYGDGNVASGSPSISPMPFNGTGSEITSNNPFSSWGIPTSAPASQNLTAGGSITGTLTSNGTYTDFICMAQGTSSSTPTTASGNGPVQKTFTLQYNET